MSVKDASVFWVVKKNRDFLILYLRRWRLVDIFVVDIQM